MASQIFAPQSPALLRRLEGLKGLRSSPAYAEFKAKTRAAVISGLAESVLSGKDGMGRPMAPLAPSTLKHRKGGGPPLAPHQNASRVITTFRATWQAEGDDDVLVRRWEGFNPARFFTTGTRRMPKRDVTQLSPQTWAKLIQFHRELMAKAGR